MADRLAAGGRAAAGNAGVVTPEAVLLEFGTAGIASRVLAELIDVTVQFMLLTTVVFAVTPAAAVGGAGEVAAVVVLIVSIFLVLFGYPVASEVLWRGRTLGKAALGLRVVTVEGGPVRFRHAAIRAALGLIDKYAFLYSLGALAILASRRNQRLGDLAAGTLVLRERSGGGRSFAVRFPVPYGYERYAASLDVSALTDREYTTVRSFLLRAPSLRPDARAYLAQQLATHIAGRLAHRPPPIPAELLLLCVAAARQQRTVAAERPAASAVPHAHARAVDAAWRQGAWQQAQPAGPPRPAGPLPADRSRQAEGGPPPPAFPPPA